MLGRLSLIWMIVAVPWLGGCRSPQYLERTESGAVDFQHFHVEYEFDQPIRRLSRGFDADPQSVVDSDIEAVAWNEQWTRARLEIECPHPSGNNDVARVTLTLQAPGPNGRGRREERRFLAIPREQIDLLIFDMAQSGVFDETLSSSGEAQLNVRIDRGRVERSWKYDGRLLDFAHRTLTRGMVVEKPARNLRRDGSSRASRQSRP
jgi:hypothetical protein